MDAIYSIYIDVIHLMFFVTLLAGSRNLFIVQLRGAEASPRLALTEGEGLLAGMPERKEIDAVTGHLSGCTFYTTFPKHHCSMCHHVMHGYKHI